MTSFGIPDPLPYINTTVSSAAASISMVSPTAIPYTGHAPSLQDSIGPPASLLTPPQLRRAGSRDDELEEYLKNKIKHDNKKDDKQIEFLLRDYRLFRDFDFPGFVRTLLFATWNSASSVPVFTLFTTPSTFRVSVNHLRHLLHHQIDGGLSLCIVTPVSVKEVRPLLPYLSRTFGSPSRLRRKYLAPRLCILHTIAQEWDLPQWALKNCIQMTETKEQLLVPHTTFLADSMPASTFSLDSGSSWLEIEFSWVLEARKYPSDFWMYISQYHMDTPVLEVVKIFVHNASDDNWEILVVENTAVVAARAQYRDEDLFFLRKKSLRLGRRMQNRTKILLFIASVFDKLIVETRSFCCEVLKHISFLRLQGRRWPSEEKLNYLLHLDDCRHYSCSGLWKASLRIKGIIGYTESHPADADAALLDIFRDLLNDIERLQSDLSDVAALTGDLRAMIKDQIDLRQIRLTGVLTFLAAIYVPFSFISGMFGMNVSDPLWNTANGPSDTKTKNEASNIPTVEAIKLLATMSIKDGAIQAPASASLTAFAKSYAATSLPATTSGLTVSSINDTISAALASQPSPHLWSFKQFWWIAVSTTAATIILPLLAPLVFRAIVRFLADHKGYWMFGVFLIGACGVTIMDLYIPHPELYYVLGVPQGLIAVIGLVWAHAKRKWVKRWTGYATALSACITFDVGLDEIDGSHNHNNGDRPDGFGVTGVIPPLCLFAVWIQSPPAYLSWARIENWIGRPVTKQWRTAQKAVNHSLIAPRVLVVIAGTLNGLLSWYVGGWIYVGLMTPPFGLYSLHKLLEAYELQMGRRKWTIFAAVEAGSFLMWVYTIVGRITGSIALFPGLLLLLYTKWDISMVWEKLWQRLFGHGPPNTAPDTEAPGTPTSVHSVTQSVNVPSQQTDASGL